jgi:hypothetical protein
VLYDVTNLVLGVVNISDLLVAIRSGEVAADVERIEQVQCSATTLYLNVGAKRFLVRLDLLI